MPVKRGRISIQRRNFSVDSELDRMLSGKAGGTVIFVGSVRGTAPGGRVGHLDFDTYGPMARKKLNDIKAAAMEKFGVEAVTVIHRTGRIRSGGRIVLIAVSAAHRDAAFKACRHVLEELKKHVPIWKQERGEWTCGERTGRKLGEKVNKSKSKQVNKLTSKQVRLTSKQVDRLTS